MAQLRFRDVTGKSIIDAIIETRLEKARTLLKNPQLTQSYIANQCGYASWTSLFACIRDPSEYVAVNMSLTHDGHI